MFIIGVDCATKDAKIGVALASFKDGKVLLEDVKLCTKEVTAAATIAEWSRRQEPVLLALDAPLGWPATLAKVLSRHRAGDPLHAVANNMFRRETDCHIKRTVGKMPLDVGADRIARTAHAALHLLEDVGTRLHRRISLAWCPLAIGQIAAIEVYPAATLTAYGFRSQGYKKARQREERRELIEAVSELIYPGVSFCAHRLVLLKLLHF
ncbi:MAG: DUF429 domain-containing protein [Planctomycetota bacterium]|nr:DUF429 domain-containing protein [Planctomycetota bacterium]